MKQKILILSVILLTTKNAKSQFISGAKFSALANASVALQDLWSANINAAGLSQMKAIKVGIAYENRFSVNELGSKTAIVAVPFKNYVVGASVQSYGIQEFKNLKAGISLTKSFGPKLSTAIRVNFHQLHIEDYENENAFTIDCGIQFQASPKLRFGAHVANPNLVAYKRIQDQNIESHIKFGGVFSFSNKLRASSEIEKGINKPIDYKMGLNYQIMDFLALRSGISVNTFRQYGGFGLTHKKLVIDFAISNHNVLGYSPQLAIAYEF